MNMKGRKRSVKWKINACYLILLRLINVWYALMGIMVRIAKRFQDYVKREGITYYLGSVYSAN